MIVADYTFEIGPERVTTAGHGQLQRDQGRQRPAALAFQEDEPRSDDDGRPAQGGQLRRRQ